MRDKMIREITWSSDTAFFRAGKPRRVYGKMTRRWQIEQYEQVNTYGLSAAKQVRDWLDRFIKECEGGES